MKKFVFGGEKTEKGRFFTQSRLFYVLVFLSIVVVGTTGYIMKTRDTDSSGTVSVPIADAGESVLVDEPVAEEIAEVADVSYEEPEIKVTVLEEVIEDTAPYKIEQMLMPVGGEVVKLHSSTELVFSKTLGDWRLHEGVDISAKIGDTVIAVADGKVVETGVDMSLGNYVVLEHEGGIVTKYYNLAPDILVTEGDYIMAGEPVGIVGDSAEFEIADNPHLHFEVLENGKQINPEKYFE